MAHDPHPFTIEFEAHCGIGSTYAADLLGMGQSTYAQVKSQIRPLKKYQRRHMEALMMLSRDLLDDLISRYTDYGDL